MDFGGPWKRAARARRSAGCARSGRTPPARGARSTSTRTDSLAGSQARRCLAAARLTRSRPTTTFAGIVACQLGNLFACRSTHESALASLPGFLRRKSAGASPRAVAPHNRLLWYAVAFEVTLLVTLIYVPALASVFGLAPLSAEHWLFVAGFGPLLLLLEEARKLAVRRLARCRA
jgi:magnesium-transporting ATPase (P-type)